MKKIRHEEDDSSLELLLDTMCNTFGGVMFIAISIFVIVAGMTQLDQVGKPAETPVAPMVIKQEIETIQLLITDMQEQLQIQMQELSTRQQINVEEETHKLAVLEQQSTALEVQCTTIDTALETLQPLLLQAENAHEQLRKSIAEARNQQKNYQVELDSLNLELQNLKSVVPVPRQVTFRVMESSNNRPFFIIMDKDSIYPIGPWQSYGAEDRIDNAVNATTYNQGGHRTVSATIKPGHGIKVLNGDNLSDQFTNFLRSIPSDRVPDFCIYPNAAATAYRMREILKSRKILHGASLVECDGDPIVYSYTNYVDYEY